MTSRLKTLILILCSTLCMSQALARDKFNEIGVKAGFIASFIAFTSWPQSSLPQQETKFLLCIAGENPYTRIFENAPKSGIRGRRLAIQQLSKKASKSELQQCHVLILRQSSEKEIARFLKRVEELPILTISEFQNKNNHDSMINMARKKNQIIFSINRTPSDNVGIQFRSKLLRLAKKVTGGEQ